MPLTRNGAPRAKKAQKFGDFTVGLRKISRKFDFTLQIVESIIECLALVHFSSTFKIRCKEILIIFKINLLSRSW